MVRGRKTLRPWPWARIPPPHAQKPLAAEDAEWKKPEFVVEATKETPLLPAVQRVVGSVCVEHGTGRWLREALHKQIDRKLGHLGGVGLDAVVKVAPFGRGTAVLQTVQCALAGQWDAAVPLPASTRRLPVGLQPNRSCVKVFLQEVVRLFPSTH